MTALKELCDSFQSSGSRRIIAMGDFNDTPDASAFDIIAPVLVNKAGCLYERGEGTIRYEGKWDLIDMFLVSPDMEDFRDAIHPKHPNSILRDLELEKPYFQVFSQKHGFQSDLSIMDLLFNEGPDSIMYLKRL